MSSRYLYVLISEVQKVSLTVSYQKKVLCEITALETAISLKNGTYFKAIQHHNTVEVSKYM